MQSGLKMKKQDLDTAKRLGQVETDLKIVRHDIDTIKNNHLAHIEKDVAKIDNRLWWVVGLLVATLLTPFVTSLLQ